MSRSGSVPGRIHRDETGQPFDSRDPCADMFIPIERDPALIRDVGVGKQRDIGESHGIPAHEGAGLKVLVHHRQRIATRNPLCHDLPALFLGQVGFADELEPEPQGRDIGFVVVLFEEHPAQHVGLGKAALRDQSRIRGKVPARRIAFGQEAARSAVSDLQHRDPAIGINPLEEFGRARFALHDVVLAGSERQAEQSRGELDLVAIAAARVFVEGVGLAHGCSPFLRSASAASSRPIPCVSGS